MLTETKRATSAAAPVSPVADVPTKYQLREHALTVSFVAPHADTSHESQLTCGLLTLVERKAAPLVWVSPSCKLHLKPSHTHRTVKGKSVSACQSNACMPQKLHALEADACESRNGQPSSPAPVLHIAAAKK